MALIRSDASALFLVGVSCPLCRAPATRATTDRVVRTIIRTRAGVRATEITYECGAGHSWGSDGRPILPVRAMDDWDGYS